MAFSYTCSVLKFSGTTPHGDNFFTHLSEPFFWQDTMFALLAV